MSIPKCSECEFGEKHNFPRNGNGASWRSGHFYQSGVVCAHNPPAYPATIFYGKTSPRTCPKRKGRERTHT